MASTAPLSATELELKRRGRRRLIGAVTLGLVAIVVLPMIFDAEPKRATKSGQEISIQIPPKNGLPPLPVPGVPAKAVIEAAPKTLPPPTPAAAPAPPPVAVVLPDKPVAAPATALVPPTAPAAAPKPAAAPAPAAAAPSNVKSGFVVQVGAFRDADNAKQIIEQMKAAKLPVFTDTVTVVGGKVTRVRLGPFTARPQAEAMVAQVKLAGAEGKVVAYP